MLTESLTFITDKKGKKISVILPIEEYERIWEELDELEDIRLYDEAKNEDDGERILFSDYLKNEKPKMPKYIIHLSKKAEKQLDKFSDSIAEPIIAAISELENNPRPQDIRS